MVKMFDSISFKKQSNNLEEDSTALTLREMTFAEGSNKRGVGFGTSRKAADEFTLMKSNNSSQFKAFRSKSLDSEFSSVRRSLSGEKNHFRFEDQEDSC